MTELTPEQYTKLTPEERAGLTPEARARLKVLEKGQQRGTLSKIELDEKWLRERLGHADYLWSVGQRDLVGASTWRNGSGLAIGTTSGWGRYWSATCN